MLLFALTFLVIMGFYCLLMIAALAKIFVKADQAWWAALIPFYNLYIYLKVIGKPSWWLAPLSAIGFTIYFNLYSTSDELIVFGLGLYFVWLTFAIWSLNMLAKSFGKQENYTFGLLFMSFIFFPLLAFGDAEYEGPYGDQDAFYAYKRKTGEQLFDFEKGIEAGSSNV